MSYWTETIERIIKEATPTQLQNHIFVTKGIVPPINVPVLDVIEAVTGWLNTSVTEYTEGSTEGVSRRVLWLFDDGWCLVIGSSMYPLITHVNNEVTVDTVVPTSVINKDWLFETSTNGWEWIKNDVTSEEILELIESLSKLHGVPKLVLPCEWKLQELSDYTETEYLEYKDEGSEEYLEYQAYYKLLNYISKGFLKLVSPWDVEIVSEDDYMPYYCDYNRFFRMTNELEEKGWLVIIDEHCAACAHGSREDYIRNNPKLKDAPEFLTWGQNSQNSWMPDGKLFTEQYVEDEKAVKELISVAAKYGFELDENLIFDSIA